MKDNFIAEELKKHPHDTACMLAQVMQWNTEANHSITNQIISSKDKEIAELKEENKKLSHQLKKIFARIEWLMFGDTFQEYEY